MNVKKFLAGIDFDLTNEEESQIKRETLRFGDLLKKMLRKKKIDAEVFVGGSFAKGTLAKSDEYDIDIFVRFGRGGEFSAVLEKILKSSGAKFERWHGSRDYFRVSSGKLTFEIIPVKKIKKICDAENVTDLSYLHVNYVRKNLAKSRRKEVRLAKQFCKSAGVYGAESYIGGFSGYALECLIIYYGSFEKMLRALSPIKEKEVIDIKKFYKRKRDVFVEMSSGKLESPMILVDPTWKERNVLAALTQESFEKFQARARAFLAKPSEKFLVVEKIDVNSLKRFASEKKAEFVSVKLKTNRQAGDIAGTKMKKFARFLVAELEKYFAVLKNEFAYSGGKDAMLYLVLKSRGVVLRKGPCVSMTEAAHIFKARNKNVFAKGRNLYAKIKVELSAGEFLGRFFGKEKKRMNEMAISYAKVI